MASKSDELGLPIRLITYSIWLRVELPGNRALPTIISPTMQPTLHISTAFVYL